jgi:hypothetical protein
MFLQPNIKELTESLVSQEFGLLINIISDLSLVKLPKYEANQKNLWSFPAIIKE